MLPLECYHWVIHWEVTTLGGYHTGRLEPPCCGTRPQERSWGLDRAWLSVNQARTREVTADVMSAVTLRRRGQGALVPSSQPKGEASSSTQPKGGASSSTNPEVVLLY